MNTHNPGRTSKRSRLNYDEFAWLGRCARVALLFLAFSIAARAETWVVEPGRGVGPLRLGQSKPSIWAGKVQNSRVTSSKGQAPPTRLATTPPTPDDLRRARQEALARAQFIKVDSRSDLVRFMAHRNPYVRCKAVAALPSGTFFPELADIARDPSHVVRRQLVHHLRGTDDPRAIPILEELGRSGDRRLMSAAANGLARYGRLPNKSLREFDIDHDLVELVVRRGSDEQLEELSDYSLDLMIERPGFRERLANRLIVSPSLLDKLIQLDNLVLLYLPQEVQTLGATRALRSQDPQQVIRGCKLAELSGSESLVPELLRLVETPEKGPAPLRALEACARPTHSSELVKLYRKAPYYQRGWILDTILVVCPEEAQELWIELSRDDNHWVREKAARGLAFAKDREQAVQVLERTANEDYRVEPQARVSLLILEQAEAKEWVRNNLAACLGPLSQHPDLELGYLKRELTELAYTQRYRYDVFRLLRHRPAMADELKAFWFDGPQMEN